MSLVDKYNLNQEYHTKYYNEDKVNMWRIYLFELFHGELRNTLEDMISYSECKSFFEGIKYEYGYGVEKNLNKAFSIYKDSAGYESKDYLSMARLYIIYKGQANLFNINKDKNLELIYLFKSFSYLPISILEERDIKFPLDLKYTIAEFLDNNDSNVEKIPKYFNELVKNEKYKNILSKNDCNLIKGFLDGYFLYSFNNVKTSVDILTALSYNGFSESTYKLIYVYLDKLSDIEEDKKKEEHLSKIYDLFLILEEKKYYKAYADYGLFLYNQLRIFDKALEIFEIGYEHKQYECSYYYFLAFIKSGNLSIFDVTNINSNKLIQIFKTLINSFIYGEMNCNQNIFDYYFTIGKKIIYFLNYQTVI